MVVVAHNILADNANRQYNLNIEKKKKSTEKLSSGYRINRSADDAAGLAISEKMRSQIRGLDRGLKNTLDGISFVQIGDGAMNEAQQIVLRMSELAIQAANGTNSDSDRKAIDDEVQQLKIEIDRIHTTTKFNEERVFDDELPPLPSLNITGRYFARTDLNIYDATYDKDTGEFTYGGIMFDGERVSWKDINADMVEMDENGNQVFTGGTYHMSWNGDVFDIVTSRGAKVPQITRHTEISQLTNKIYIGSKEYNLGSFVDENGDPFFYQALHDGVYTHSQDEDVKVDFSVYFGNEADYMMFGDPQEMAVEALNRYKRKLNWDEIWAGKDNIKAMDVTAGRMVDIKSRDVMMELIAAADSTGAIQYRVRAGKTDEGTPGTDEGYSKNGIWLERIEEVPVKNENGAQVLDGNGNPVTKKMWMPINNSLKTWEDVGLKDQDGDIWNATKEIRDSVTSNVEYLYDDGVTTVGFTFELEADTTSLDSVIAGMDEMLAFSQGIKTDYTLQAKADGKNIQSVILTNSYSGRNLVTPQEEIDFGRNLAQKKVENVAKDDKGEIDFSNKVTFNLTGGSGSANFEGDASVGKASLKSGINTYGTYILRQKTNLALYGLDPQNDLGTVVPDKKDLRTILGASNVTSEDTLADTVTITNTMKLSDGNSGRGGRPGVVGETYAAAYIDFSSVTDLSVLENSGFDSTCGFCSTHYSLRFTDSGSYGFDSVKDDNNHDLKYQLTKSGDNYVLNVDIDSLKKAGYTGSNLADALVKVVSGKEAYGQNSSFTEDGFDFHFTQYASENGSKLYIFSNQNQGSSLSHAQSYSQFWTMPYDDKTVPPSSGRYNVSMTDTTSTNNRSATLSYGYDFSDIKDQIVVNMKDAALNNQFVTASESDEGILYEKDGDVYKVWKKPAPPTDPNDPIPPTPQLYKYNPTETMYSKTNDGKYTEWKPQNIKGSAVPTLYRMDVQFKKDGTAYSDLNSLAEDYTNDAFKTMIEGTSMHFDARDFSKVRWSSNEKKNEATTSKFESHIYSRAFGGHRNDISIRHSQASNDTTTIPKFSLNTFVLGLSTGSCKTESEARRLINKTSGAQRAISYRRSIYGAIQNRLEATYRNRDNTRENTTAAESRIRDTDISKEMVTYQKHTILEQVGQTILSQANQSQQSVISLLGS